MKIEHAKRGSMLTLSVIFLLFLSITGIVLVQWSGVSATGTLNAHNTSQAYYSAKSLVDMVVQEIEETTEQGTVICTQLEALAVGQTMQASGLAAGNLPGDAKTLGFACTQQTGTVANGTQTVKVTASATIGSQTRTVSRLVDITRSSAGGDSLHGSVFFNPTGNGGSEFNLWSDGVIRVKTFYNFGLFETINIAGKMFAEEVVLAAKSGITIHGDSAVRSTTATPSKLVMIAPDVVFWGGPKLENIEVYASNEFTASQMTAVDALIKAKNLTNYCGARMQSLKLYTSTPAAASPWTVTGTRETHAYNAEVPVERAPRIVLLPLPAVSRELSISGTITESGYLYSSGQAGIQNPIVIDTTGGKTIDLYFTRSRTEPTKQENLADIHTYSNGSITVRGDGIVNIYTKSAFLQATFNREPNAACNLIATEGEVILHGKNFEFNAIAPVSTVTVQDGTTLRGSVVCSNLVINSKGTVDALAPADGGYWPANEIFSRIQYETGEPVGGGGVALSAKAGQYLT